jgi:hypothetical protein
LSFNLLALEIRHTGATDASLVLQFFRHALQQHFRKIHFGAPTGSFVHGVCTELAVIALTA